MAMKCTKFVIRQDSPPGKGECGMHRKRGRICFRAPGAQATYYQFHKEEVDAALEHHQKGGGEETARQVAERVHNKEAFNMLMVRALTMQACTRSRIVEVTGSHGLCRPVCAPAAVCMHHVNLRACSSHASMQP